MNIPIPQPGETLYYGEQGDPLIIIIHDWFGRLPWIDPLARALEREGFQVAVPDFFDGFATTDIDEARGQLDKVDIGAALALLDDIIDEARLYGTTKVGELGFSTGGWVALVHAQGGEVDAVVAYYASIAEKHHGVIPCPVLLQYAESDEWEYGGDPAAFLARLSEHGTPTTQFHYLATQHHFANLNVHATAEPQAAALAAARTNAFFAMHLFD